MTVQDYVTRPEHDDLKVRVAIVEDTTRTVLSRVDRIEGMFTLLRAIFGVSVLSALVAMLSLLELVTHAAK